jgi:hypothetical protein
LPGLPRRRPMRHELLFAVTHEIRHPDSPSRRTEQILNTTIICRSSASGMMAYMVQAHWQWPDEEASNRSNLCGLGLSMQAWSRHVIAVTDTGLGGVGRCHWMAGVIEQ